MRERIIAANERRIAKAAAERAGVVPAGWEPPHKPGSRFGKKRPKNLPAMWQRPVIGWRGVGGAVREAEEWKLSEGYQAKNLEDDGDDDDESDDSLSGFNLKQPGRPTLSMRPRDQMARAVVDHRHGGDNDPERSMRPKYINERNRKAMMEKQELMSGALVSKPGDETHRDHKSPGNSQASDTPPYEAEHRHSSKSKSRRLVGRRLQHNNTAEPLQAPDTTQVKGAELVRCSNLESCNIENEGSQHCAPPEACRALEFTVSEGLVTVRPAHIGSQLEEPRSGPDAESHDQPNETQRRRHGKRRGECSNEHTPQEMSRKPSLQNLSVKADSAVECAFGGNKGATEVELPAAVDVGPSAPGAQHVGALTEVKQEREIARPQLYKVVLQNGRTAFGQSEPRKPKHERTPRESREPKSDLLPNEPPESKLQGLESTEKSPPQLTAAVLGRLERWQHEEHVAKFTRNPHKPGHTDYSKQHPRELQAMNHIVKWLKGLRRPSSRDRRLHTPWENNLQDLESKDSDLREVGFGESVGGPERFNYGYDPQDGMTKISDNAPAAPIRPIYSADEALARFEFGFSHKETCSTM